MKVINSLKKKVIRQYERGSLINLDEELENLNSDLSSESKS